jgi:alkanesulfonate monooxygenase SsuD/methylene tetrahydromethanopterin reductase-like flavin-dependent oxidoreductase (luciferase family)
VTIRLGLFDNLQVDPLDPADTATVYARRLADLALADELGFEVAFTAERHFMPNYRAPAPSAWVAAASQRTRRLRLGVLAYTLPLHAPFRLAEEVAVLDHLSGGRLEVGLGLGHRPEELAAIGLDPGQRIPVFQERLALLRALWSGGQVGYESAHSVLREVAIHPLPRQEPHPPLWYAGTDPGAAAWAAAQGMDLAVGFAPIARLAPTARAHAAARPAERGGRIALLRHAYVAESDAAARAEMTEDLMRLEEWRSPSPPGEGSRADRRENARAHAAALVRDELAFAGGPETVAADLLAARDALGIGLFLAHPYLAGLGDERVHRTLRLLATEVRPRLEAATAAPTL